MKYSLFIFILIFSLNVWSFGDWAVKNDCRPFIVGGEEDLIPWPMSQCPWSISNLYGQWTVKSTSKNPSTKLNTVEFYNISASAMGASIVRTKANKTKDSGFILIKKQKNKQIFYKAVMYSSNGSIYFLSIHTRQTRKKNYKNQLFCHPQKQNSITHAVFIKHKTQNFWQCGGASKSWLLKKQTGLQ